MTPEALAALLLDMYGPWGGPPRVRRNVWLKHLRFAHLILAAMEEAK